MKIFIKLAYLPNNELIWFLKNIMKPGDVYNNGEKRYSKISKLEAV